MQLIKLYISTLKTLNKSPHTIRCYQYDLRHFYRYAVEKYPSAKVEPSSFKQLCFDYIAFLETDKSYSTRSLNRKRTSLRKFVRYLASHKYIDDFSDEITLSPISPQPMTILNLREISAIISVLHNRMAYARNPDMLFMHHRNLLAFLTLLYTGIKVNELVTLKWNNIHWDKQCIVVPKRKGILVRKIFVPKSLLDEFKRFQKTLSKILPDNEPLSDGYIFFGTGRSPMQHLNPKTIERLVDSLAKEARLTDKNITPHSLRHTMAYYAIQKDTPLPQLSHLLGHSRNSVTKHMYSQLFE